MTHTPTRRQFLAGAAVAALQARGLPLPGVLAPKGLVTGQAEAVVAGNAVLADGGNAVDAIVGAALVAGVVATPATGIGGYGGHLTLVRPGGKVFAIDFNTTAPAAAKPELYPLDEKGVVKGRVHYHGWLAAGVPGVLAGLQLALDRFGTKKFADVVKPAIKHARDGFPVTRNVAAAIKGARDRFAKDPGSARLYLKNGEPLAEGGTFRNLDLAAMLEALAGKGRVDAFYTGDVAQKIAAAFRANGGLVTAADLAAYKAVEVKPLMQEWHGVHVYTPPPSSGGLTVLQVLATLKALEWWKMDPKDPATVQAQVEAVRIAWHDRLTLLGDPDRVSVPVRNLLSEDYAKQSGVRVREAVKSKKPVEAKSDGRPAGGTIHLCAADAAGMMAALTFTHGDGFGACVTVDGLGLTLGHGMSRFDVRPGRPNSVAPGKRPLHNMCPVVVEHDGDPILAAGATGGRRIPNTVLQVLVSRYGRDHDLADAVKAPRFQTEGDLNLTLEAAWPAAVADHFKQVGYTLRTGPGASLNAIERDPTDGSLRSAAR